MFCINKLSLSDFMISIVIPCYNEEKRIINTLKKTIKYLENKKYNYEIIIVDDFSKDNTIKIIDNLKNKKIKILQNEKNYGKGYSIKKGMLNAKYPLVLFMDADLATPIEELDKFTKEIKNYDILIASRKLNNSNISKKQPFYRQILGKIFLNIVKLFAIKEFKDTQCGFKLFKKDVAKDIFELQTINRFAFDVEILYIALKKNYKIKELPVKWIDQKGSTVNPVKDSISMLKDLLKIRFNDFLGKYK